MRLFLLYFFTLIVIGCKSNSTRPLCKMRNLNLKQDDSTATLYKFYNNGVVKSMTQYKTSNFDTIRYVQCWENGNKRVEVNKENEKQTISEISYWDNGDTASIEFYNIILKSGFYKSFYKNGLLKEKQTIKNGGVESYEHYEIKNNREMKEVMQKMDSLRMVLSHNC